MFQNVGGSTKYVVVGTNTSTHAVELARYNRNGTLDTSFGVNGVVTTALTGFQGANAAAFAAIAGRLSGAGTGTTAATVPADAAALRTGALDAFARGMDFNAGHAAGLNDARRSATRARAVASVSPVGRGGSSGRRVPDGALGELARLHHRDDERLWRQAGHQPASTGVLQPGAEPGNDVRKPKGAEGRVTQWKQRGGETHPAIIAAPREICRLPLGK